MGLNVRGRAGDRVFNWEGQVMPEIKITQDVNDFIKKCSDIVGKHADDTFNQETSLECVEKRMESPIEHIFYTAFRTLMKINYMRQAEPEMYKGEFVFYGTDIIPQVQIGDYRVDFIVCHAPILGQPGKNLIVECDSQEFHDRDEKQRRYEKKRERFLQSQGFHIYRFTGSEIKRNPFKVAAESISYITGWEVENILDPNFGVE